MVDQPRISVLVSVLVVWQAGCNICAGVEGTCTAVSIEGAGDFDQLEFTLNGATDLRVLPATPRRTSLPQELALGTSGAIWFVGVRAFLDGRLVGQSIAEYEEGQTGTWRMPLSLCRGSAPALCGGVCVPDVSRKACDDDTSPPIPGPTGSTASTGTMSPASPGTTQPTTPSGSQVANGFHGGAGLQLASDGRLYWASRTSASDFTVRVWMYEPTTGAAPTVILTLPSTTSAYDGLGIVTDASTRYVAHGAISSMPITGGAMTVIASSGVSNYVGNLALSGSQLFVPDSRSAPGGAIVTLATSGGSVTPLFSGFKLPNSVALGGNRLYWAHEDGLSTALVTDANYVNLRAGAKASNVVATETHAAWLEGSAVKIYYAPEVKLTSISRAKVGDVALSANRIAWSAELSGGSKGVFVAPIPSSTATTISETMLSVTATLATEVAITASQVFWLENGTLMAATLP